MLIDRKGEDAVPRRAFLMIRSVVFLKHLAAVVRLVGVLALLSVTVTGQTAEAQPVSLRRGFFTGWRFSVDGKRYRKVGNNADSLRVLMGNCRICTTRLDAYHNDMTAAHATGILSAFMIGWPVGSKIRGKEWSDGFTPMLAVGILLAVISIRLEATGSGNLKRAVRYYNATLPLSQQSPGTTEAYRSPAVVSLRWRF